MSINLEKYEVALRILIRSFGEDDSIVDSSETEYYAELVAQKARYEYETGLRKPTASQFSAIKGAIETTPWSDLAQLFKKTLAAAEMA